jgi:HlyD family secretion protein
VLIVPNAALRWVPTKEQVSPELLNSDVVSRVLGATATMGPPMGGPGMTVSTPTPQAAVKAIGVVWIADGSFVRPLEVDIGVSDGIKTEISGKDIKSGMTVVIVQFNR